MERSKALAALSAMAHETRLDLIRLLIPYGQDGMPAGRIAETLGIAAPKLSFHLSALEQAGLLRSRKVARNVYYTVDATGIGRTISYILNDCCCDNPEVLAACSPDRRSGSCGARQGERALSGTENT
jgi:ArsR family transcriptional regulator, arsenate/arsenite/antimonite-responsive transcriptional repressor